MIMRLDRDEIEALLKDLPKDKCAVFALRSAMRVLPFLAIEEKQEMESRDSQPIQETFWFWDEKDKAKHLLAVYWAYVQGLEYTLVKDATITTKAATKTVAKAALYAARDARSRVDAIADDAARVARVARPAKSAEEDAVARAARIARAAAYAAGARASRVVEAAAYAAYAAYAARVADTDAFAETYAAIFTAAKADSNVILHEMTKDLSRLNHLSITDLIKQPLWSKLIPKEVKQLINDFKNNALSLNAGFEIWLDWYEDRLLGKPVDLALIKQWNHIPNEIKEQSAEKVNAYLKNLNQKTEIQPLNRVRAIFIGYGEAGKTSLIRALHDEPVVENEEDMTAGVDIRNWPVPDSNIHAHFWDFGGQVMAHSTHQFFLRESCLYIVVLNARSEINSTEQAEYWLEHVKAFGKNSPVMLVGNKADQANINLDMSYLKDKYPNIFDAYSLSCTQAKTRYKAKFDSFKQDFCQQLRQVGTHQMQFTQEQFKVLEELRHYSPKNAFLPHKKFESMCEKHGVTNEGELNRGWLLEILDKLGVVIHFPQLAFLDEYVLNPRWLTHGVYTLMYQQQAQLTERDAVAILRDKKIIDEDGNVLDYPMAKCRFILEAMQEFKLSYPLINQANTFIIPELLHSDRPEKLSFEKQGALAFEFKFTGFLPRHIMPQLIVSRHQEIVDQIVWQNGVLLQHQSSITQALLEVSYHDRIINIWVQGQEAKDYLSILNDELLTILGRLDLVYDEYIELPLTACRDTENIRLHNKVEKASYRQLLACAKKQQRDYISKSGLEYDLESVLGVIMSKPEQEKLGITNNYWGNNPVINQAEEQNLSNKNVYVNDSIVNGSVVAAEKIENSLNSLNQSNAESEDKILLEQLLNEIKDLNDKVPESQAIVDMSEEAETLINESKRESPRKRWYETSLKGIEEAAKTLGGIAKPVLDVAKALSPLLLG